MEHPPPLNASGVDLLARAESLLEERYFYSQRAFAGRVRRLTIEKPGEGPLHASKFEAYPGAPFLLVVAPPRDGWEDLKDAVFAEALTHETLGVVAAFLPGSEEPEVFRRKHSDGHFEQAVDLEHHFRGSSRGSWRLLEERVEYDGEARGGEGASLAPLPASLENLFFEIHSILRDTDGLHSDLALEELCKLLYLKTYAEEQEARLPVHRLGTAVFGSTEEFAAALRGTYREAREYDVRVFSLKIPEYRRSRGVFNEPILLSSAALVAAFQQIEDFTLLDSEVDLKGRAFQRVLSSSARHGMGQYFTPSQVCDLIVDVLRPTAADLIIDPFCGSGHFLSRALSRVAAGCDRSSKAFHEFAFGKMHGIEKSERMTRVAMTDMRLNGDGHSNIRCTDALLDFRNYPDIEPESFDLVMTNPPFGSILGSEAFTGLGRFELKAGKKRLPLEVAGLERSIQLLRHGGRIGIVLPESIFNGASFAYVRDWLLHRVVPRVIVALPPETFSPFGANVRTGVLFARRLRRGETGDPDAKIMMLKIEDLGYDAAGRHSGRSDLREANALIHTFLAEEGW